MSDDAAPSHCGPTDDEDDYEHLTSCNVREGSPGLYHLCRFPEPDLLRFDPTLRLDMSHCAFHSADVQRLLFSSFLTDDRLRTIQVAMIGRNAWYATNTRERVIEIIQKATQICNLDLLASEFSNHTIGAAEFLSEIDLSNHHKLRRVRLFESNRKEAQLSSAVNIKECRWSRAERETETETEPKTVPVVECRWQRDKKGRHIIHLVPGASNPDGSVPSAWRISPKKNTRQ